MLSLIDFKKFVYKIISHSESKLYILVWDNTCMYSWKLRVYMSQACAFLNTCMHLVSLILQYLGLCTSELGETHFPYRLESVIYSQRVFKLFSPENACNEVSDLLDCLQTN